MVPGHVLTAFRADDSARREQLGPAWDNGVKVGQVVYSEAVDHAHWSANLRESLEVEGVRIARPVQSTDGRYLIGGWKATAWVPGGLARRVDETTMVALRLADALAEKDMPPQADSRTDEFARAERAAWQEMDELLGPVDAPWQAGHADVLSSTLYSGSAPPTVTDLVPFAAPRPHGFSAALVIVDGLILGAVDEAILDRFAHVPHIGQLTRRALAYRRHVSDLHPLATSSTRSNVARVEELLLSRESATI